MNSTFRNAVITFIVTVIFSASVLHASPMITADTADWTKGMIREGELKVLKHTFKIKNTGDSVLVIQSVKPG
jgi:hypothetical protein